MTFLLDYRKRFASNGFIISRMWHVSHLSFQLILDKTQTKLFYYKIVCVEESNMYNIWYTINDFPWNFPKVLSYCSHEVTAFCGWKKRRFLNTKWNSGINGNLRIHCQWIDNGRLSNGKTLKSKKKEQRFNNIIIHIWDIYVIAFAMNWLRKILSKPCRSINTSLYLQYQESINIYVKHIKKNYSKMHFIYIEKLFFLLLSRNTACNRFLMDSVEFY